MVSQDFSAPDLGNFRPGGPVALRVRPEEEGWRLDVFLTHHFADYSRVHMRRLITAGGVRVDGKGAKPAYRLHTGQQVELVLPEIPREAPHPEPIPLDILYQDDYLAVVNKPAGMVVHPARGHWSGTLVSALQYHFGGRLSAAGGPTRPGIVHRLDRDTSGAILVAKTDPIHQKLAAQFANRTVEKEYFTLVSGRPERDRDVVVEPIGLHPTQREKMAIRRQGPDVRLAETFYEVLERFDGFAAMRILPRTGRTHQIRVHLAHIGCPVLCDRQYGGRSQITLADLSRNPADTTVLLARQALHARRIGFTHPVTGQRLQVEAPLPSDIQAVLDALRQFRNR
ncbi:MAG TPA: RluA family pseudouridine synthase [Thermoguttaceae bacterium]|nr:RluA family pseudouridine synthase [Thermoguttaceae bacterium]